LETDLITYNSTITACEQGSFLQQALAQLLAEMQAHQVETDLITYSFTITAYEKGSVWQQLLAQLLAEMQAHHGEPTLFTYNFLFRITPLPSDCMHFV